MLRLSRFPYVVVRLRCRRCPRHGSYRLARLVARFGAEATLAEVMTELSADCPLRAPGRITSTNVCGIHCPDLGGPRPPDMPPGAGSLRVVRGGKAA